MGADLELRRRIERFDVDAGAHPGYFAEKLAYENNWTNSFTGRARTSHASETACSTADSWTTTIVVAVGGGPSHFR